MKINNFDTLVQQVKYVFMLTDAFVDKNNKIHLFLDVNVNGNGMLVVNPLDANDLVYLDDVRQDDELSHLSMEERVSHVISNEKDYEDMAYMFLECAYIESA